MLHSINRKKKETFKILLGASRWTKWGRRLQTNQHQVNGNQKMLSSISKRDEKIQLDLSFDQRHHFNSISFKHPTLFQFQVNSKSFDSIFHLLFCRSRRFAPRQKPSRKVFRNKIEKGNSPRDNC